MEGFYESKINFKCELAQKELENDFFSQDIKSSLKYLKPVIVLLGFLYLAFLYPDYFLIKSRDVFQGIFVSRIIFFVLIMIFYFRFDKIRNYNVFSFLISAYELLCSFFSLYVFHMYDSPDYLIQAFGIMVLLLVLFIFPNKWLNNFMVSILIGVSFVVMSSRYYTNIPFSVFSAGFFYILIVILLCCIFSYNLNYYKRMQYLTNKELEKMAVVDQMTGLYNKNRFKEELKRCIGYARRYEAPLTVAILDFDDFKNINDTYGHIFGDKAIIQLSALMESSIRSTDILSKWGGDEFVLLMPNTELSSAICLIERLRLKIAELSFEGIRITCSFGIAALEDEDDETTILNKADKNLYLAKAEGKNKIRF